MKLSSFFTFLASLLIAFVLWLNVQPLYDPDKEREMQVKLELRDLSPNLAVIQAPESVTVFASGTTEQLDRLDSRDITAFVNLSAAKAGEAEYPVEVAGPSGRRVTLRARRSDLSLDIERTDSKEHDIELETTGLPPAEYVYDGATLVPALVNLSGPESSLGKVAKVRALIDLSRIAPRSDFNLKLEALDADGKPVPMVTIEPESVRVSPAVVSAPTTKRVIINAAFEGAVANGYEVTYYEVKPVQIELTGPSRELSKVSQINTAPISLKGLKSDTTIPVKLVIPPGLKATAATPTSITIRIAPVVRPSGAD